MAEAVSISNLIDQAMRLEAFARRFVMVARESEVADIRLAAQRLRAVAEGTLLLTPLEF